MKKSDRRECSRLWSDRVRSKLAAVGVLSPRDMQSDRSAFERGAPVLLEILPKIESESVAIGVINWLRSRWAGSDVARHLVAMFLETGNESIRWQLASALADTADRSVQDQIAELWLDHRYGRARQMLAQALVRSKHPKAAELLARDLDDRNVRPHALSALGKLKAARYRDAIAAFLDAEDKLTRTEARRAVNKIDRAIERRTHGARTTRLPRASFEDRDSEPPMRLQAVRKQAQLQSLLEFQQEVVPEQFASLVEHALRIAGVSKCRDLARGLHEDIERVEPPETATYMLTGDERGRAPIIIHWLLEDPETVELSIYAPQSVISTLKSEHN